MSSTSADVILIILALILPPVAVLIETGCSSQFVINLLLTLLGHIPGVIHAIYVVLKRGKERDNRIATNQEHAPLQQSGPHGQGQQQAQPAHQYIPPKQQQQQAQPAHQYIPPKQQQQQAQPSHQYPPSKQQAVQPIKETYPVPNEAHGPPPSYHQ